MRSILTTITAGLLLVVTTSASAQQNIVETVANGCADEINTYCKGCLLYTSPSPRD